MKICLLGVIGPWQIALLLGLIAIPVLIILLVRGSRRKGKSDTHVTIVNTQSHNSANALEQIERLNKLRESGALTQEEFEAEKKKLLK